MGIHKTERIDLVIYEGLITKFYHKLRVDADALFHGFRCCFGIGN